MDLFVDSAGDIRCIYGEELDLRELGQLTITRASHVEPDRDGFWWADMGPVDGPVLGPFKNRTEALQAERGWLETTTGFDTVRQRASPRPVSDSSSASFIRPQHQPRAFAETVCGGENVQPEVSVIRRGCYGRISSFPLSHAGTPPSRPNSHAISNLCRYVSVRWLRGRGVPRPFPTPRERDGQG